MEKTKKASKKRNNASFSERISSAYQEYLLINGKKPSSVYKFCFEIGIKEEEFYTIAGSFDELEKEIWAAYIRKTIKILETDAGFADFSSREKMLAFYFTLMEVLKSNRSFAVHLLHRNIKLEILPYFLKSFKTIFVEYSERVMQAGKAKGEVPPRPYLDKRYPELFWVHTIFLLLFWRDDGTPDFEKTDAFVEKSVNLAFDLIGKGALDSAIDFGKFLYQSKMN